MSSTRRFNIGVVWSPQADQVEIFRVLQSYASVRFVMPNEKRMVELLVIPDNVGMYCGSAAFVQNNQRKISPKMMCPFAETFRLDCMDYYVDKGIPIAGIGDGAAWLWAHLGGKISISGNGYGLLSNPTIATEILDEHGMFVNEFANEGLYGFPSIRSQNFFELIRGITSALQQDADQYKVKPKQPPAGGENKDAEDFTGL